MSFFDKTWGGWDEAWFEIRPKLHRRTKSWDIAFNHLKKCEHPLIIETGSMRHDNEEGEDFGDGASTWMFNEFLKHHHGKCVSVDIEYSASTIVKNRCPRVSHLCSDSIAALNLLKGNASLLYLDSFDVHFDDDTPSSEHHLKELLAARHLINEATMILVDDTQRNEDGALEGKGRLIDEFMNSIHNPALFSDGYQVIYKGF